MDDQPGHQATYASLLAENQPGVIETEQEHERLLTIAEGLMEKGAAITPDEERLLALVVLLIEVFESSVEEAEELEDEEELPAPGEALKRLLDRRGLGVSDVADVFGNPHLANEAIIGRKPISRGQAKALGRFLGVPPKLFLPD